MHPKIKIFTKILAQIIKKPYLCITKNEEIKSNQSKIKVMNTIFLSNYRPANDMFTTYDEIAEIERELGLEGKTKEQLTEARNEVVKYYSEAIRVLDSMNERDEAYNTMLAMQSVTAAIDHLKLKAGASVEEL